MPPYRSALPLLILLLIALAAPGADHDSVAPDREVEVWSALINNGLDDKTKMVVLAESTSGDAAALARDPATAAAVIKQLGVPASLFADWARRNAGVDAIERPLKLKVSYQVLNAKTRAELFEGADPVHGWQQFFTRFAGASGLLRISHVGFDDNFGHALVYLEQVCGADCGAGHLFHLLHDAQGGWTVQDDTTVWMVK